MDFEKKILSKSYQPVSKKKLSGSLNFYCKHFDFKIHATLIKITSKQIVLHAFQILVHKLSFHGPSFFPKSHY